MSNPAWLTWQEIFDSEWEAALAANLAPSPPEELQKEHFKKWFYFGWLRAQEQRDSQEEPDA